MFDLLPEEILFQIFDNLDLLSLCRCGQTCKAWNSATSYGKLWSSLNEKHWGEKIEKEKNAKEIFKKTYQENKKYFKVHKKIKTTLNSILYNIASINNNMVQALLPGLSEKELDEIEKREGIQLPIEIRCFYKFYNGQKHTYDGTNKTWFFGKVTFYDVANFYPLSPLQILTIKGRTFLIISKASINSSILCCLSGGESEGEVKTGNVLMVNTFRKNSGYVIADDFFSFISDFCQKLSNNYYPVFNDILYRFESEKSWECTTNNIKIKVYIYYSIEVVARFNLYAYLVEFKMAEDVSKNQACQLVSRRWDIVKDNRSHEVVQGDGVVGEYPAFEPGTHYIYMSCNNYIGKWVTMGGSYTVKIKSTGELKELKIPTFKMTTPHIIHL